MSVPQLGADNVSKAPHGGQPEEHELNKQLNELGSCVRKTNSGCSRGKRRLLINKLFSPLVPKTPQKRRNWMDGCVNNFPEFSGDS